MGRWRRYAGAASGAVLGGIAGNLPGAFVGGNLGYKYGKASESSYPKYSTTMPNTYPTPTTGSRGSRKRKLSSRAGGSGAKRIKKTLFVGQSQRAAYNKAIGRSKSRRPVVHRKRRGRAAKGTTSLGPYTGRFGKTKRNVQSIEARCLSQGYHKTIEQFGGISDPDCVHIAHSTANVLETSYTMASALIRKVMTKAGFKITNAHVNVAVSDPVSGTVAIDDSTGLKFVYTGKESASGAFETIVYETLVNASFGGILDAFGVSLGNKFIDYIRDSITYEPYRLAVYKKDESVLTHWRLGAELFLEDMHMDVYFQSSLVIQNRTKAANNADGTSADQLSLDRVDIQPLKGYIYDFKHGDPRVKHQGAGFVSAYPFSNQVFNMIPEPGLNLVRGVQFQPAQEPLQPKFWSNCNKSTQVMVQPGEMKKLSFSHVLKGKVTTLIKNMKACNWLTITTSTYYTGIIGHCQMISLEELMRTPSTNLVTLAYERELKIGAIAKEMKRQAPLETKLIAQEFNNFGP